MTAPTDSPPTLATLPPDAHFEVACPYCQIRGTLTAVSTSTAAELRWHTPTVARFVAIRCPTCSRSFDIEAERTPPAVP